MFADLLLDAHEDDAGKIEKIAATIAAVVSYARPFSGNRGENTVRDFPEEYLDVLSAAERQLHDRLLETRHREFAHTDADVNDLSVKVRDFGGEKTSLPLSRNTMVPLEPAAARQLIGLLDKLMEKTSLEKGRIEEGFEVGDRF